MEQHDEIGLDVLGRTQRDNVLVWRFEAVLPTLRVEDLLLHVTCLDSIRKLTKMCFCRVAIDFVSVFGVVKMAKMLG